jgi:hypothetical protein
LQTKSLKHKLAIGSSHWLTLRSLKAFKTLSNWRRLCDLFRDGLEQRPNVHIAAHGVTLT